MLLPFQLTAFCISLIESPILLALLVDALRMKCVVNIIMTIPAIVISSYTYLAMDFELMGLMGSPMIKIILVNFIKILSH